MSGQGSAGAQLLLISFATTRLYGICNGGNNGIITGKRGWHILQPQSLVTGDKCPSRPKFPELCLGLGGAQNGLSPATRLKEI